MVIYGAGFMAVQLVFVMFYWHAYSLRAVLRLDAHELSMTREEIQGFLLNTVVGLASMAIAVLGGEGTISWAGWIYLLLFPLQMINGRLMKSRKAKRSSSRSSVNGEGGTRRGRAMNTTPDP